MRERLSRLGARLGNWNDRNHQHYDTRSAMPRRWCVLDRVAGWLYTLPDRGR